MDLECALQHVGQGGRQQVKYLLVLCLFKMYSAFHTLQYSFVGRSSTFQCFTSNQTLANQCPGNMVSECTNLTFNEKTIVAEWALVCDRNWMGKITMSALMFGFLQGALVLGRIADKLGRKLTLMIVLWGLIISNFLSSVTGDYTVYLISRLMVGFFVAGQAIIISVIVSELVGPAYRGVFGMAILVSYPLGITALAFTASFYQDWRELSQLVSLMGLPFLACHWYLVESPVWLLTHRRQQEAEAVLYTIARGNGAQENVVINLKLGPVAADSMASKDSVMQLFTRKRLCLMTLVLCYNWFVNGASYYGMTLAAGTLGTDIYTGIAWSGAVEVPAVFLAYCAIEQGGRRVAMVGFMTLSGVASLLVQSSYGRLPIVGPYLALLGKMCIAASFKIAYIISGEIFPTSIRTSSMGMVSAMARVGSILSPFIVMVGETLPGFQFTIFAILGLSGGLLSLGLPETKGRRLPSTLDEVGGGEKPDTETV
eukprot:TRINITY_DN42033_c0_g1_i1.p1 TRINITY_DN42033_c0_g1~~TRINITY_DN42033_c0_g1_i1.p1  ORF type:complete len:484 (-),score=83.47 TRINITY_DN42033_c0_g1_i1:89-1540(-)